MIIADTKTVSFANLTPHLKDNTFRRSISRMLNVEKTRNARQRARRPEMKTVIKIKRSELVSTTMKEGWKIHQIQEIYPAG